jgi:hypothetical protein
MQLPGKILLMIFLLFSAIFLNGCTDKFFFPQTSLEITSVDPYELIPTATDTASLPVTQINIKSLSTIPCSLKGYSIKYFTSLGEEITSARVEYTNADLKIDGEAEISISIRAYSRRMVDIFELSASDIAPVTARITLNFKDINNNHLSREAHCLLFKPEAAETAAEEVVAEEG